MKTLLYSVAMTTLVGTVWAQDVMKTITPDAVTWMDSAALPKGAKGAVLIGDPTKTGDVIVVRVKFPANYFAPPHTHPYPETVTVLSGSLGHGMSDKVEKTGEMFKVGSFFSNPAKHPHYIWTDNEEAIIEVHYIGPSALDYVNPADDPRKK